jgi:hypothetical protein
MKTATAQIEGISVLQQGRYHKTEKREKESADDYERRTWKERLHTDEDGFVFIPPMAFKKSIETAAKYLSIAIPGRGKALYTKHFKSGILVPEAVPLGVHKDDVDGVWVLGNSQGRAGAAGPRVEKCFPTLRQWAGTVVFLILDEIITEEVFNRCLIEAGNMIGIGVFRPENGGYHGRFKVIGLSWS